MINVLITDRDLGYKLLRPCTRTLSKRLRETNEKMAGFLALSGGVDISVVASVRAKWYSAPLISFL